MSKRGPESRSDPSPEAYVAELKREFPKLRVIDKSESAFCKLLHGALIIVTFGQQRFFLSRYVTTIGQRIYLPAGWEKRDPRSRYTVLRHEAVHLRQFRRYTLVGAALIYLLPILPLGLAAGRAMMEWEAYAETFRATAEVYGIKAARAPTLREHVIRQFTSGAYGWMWPFPKQLHRRIDALLDEIEATI